MRSYSGSSSGALSPSAISAATPIETASAPSASAFATSAPRADAARDDQLHLAVHVELLQRLDREPHGGQRGDADVLDEDVLRRGRAALHAVDDDDVGARLDRQRDVVVRARRPDLDEDRLLPVGQLAQLDDLDLEVVGPVPVGVAAGAALVDALRQRAHLGHAVGDLVAEQHAAAAGLGALADDDLDRVGAAQVVGVHPVARGQQLVDEQVGVAALLRRHAAVAGRRRGADLARAAPERLLGGRRERAEAHAGDRDRDLQLERLLGVARAQRDGRVAALAVALERIARHARAEEQEVVEVGEAALRAEAADVVDALARGALDLGDDVAVVEVRLAQPGVPAGAGRRPAGLDRLVFPGHQYAPALSTLKV